MLFADIKKDKKEKQQKLDDLNRQMLKNSESKKPVKYDPKLFRKFAIKM